MCKIQPTYIHRRFKYDSQGLLLLNTDYSDVFNVKLRFCDGDHQLTYDAACDEEQLLAKIKHCSTFGCIIMP